MKLSKLKDKELYKSSLFWFLVLKNIISGLSIAGGFYFVQDLVSKSIQIGWACYSITIILLLIIEVTSVLFLLYSFNLFFRGNGKYMDGSLYFIVFLISGTVSFWCTTNGLKFWLQEKENITIEIKSNLSDSKSILLDSIYSDYLHYKNISDSLIGLSQRKYVSERQTERQRTEYAIKQTEKYFDLYMQNVNKLDTIFNQEIKQADKEVIQYSNTYYLGGVIIMSLLILFNFLYAKYDHKVENFNKIIRGKSEISLKQNEISSEISSKSITKDAIQKLKDKRKTQKEIAKHFKTSESKISRILNKNGNVR